MKNVSIIGGGAAGLCAAIAAANNGARVCIYEAGERVGSKILATGNGRCNLTNMNLSPINYNNPDFVAPVIEQLGPRQIRAWFKQQGLLTAEEREGRVYPLSNTANSVLDVLRYTCERYNVKIESSIKVERLYQEEAGLSLLLNDGRIEKTDNVVVACGGGSQLLASCGHNIVPCEPILCALATNTDAIRGLNGIKARGKITLLDDGQPVFTENGEVLFRDYGVSGIVIFNASRYARPGQTLVIDFMPDMGFSGLEALIADRNAWAASYEELMCGLFHPQINRAILRMAHCKVSAKPDSDGIHRIANTIKEFSVEIKGVGDAKHAQVTRGGGACDEFEPSTLESKLLSGLYACGECLDIDGPCGGYNLHWAWASGLVAGTHAAQ